ncbi:MAG TPA: hypothetical protein VH280_23520 [Verrucomicrobiae bacterium]|jgi:hypothetical protein|nr:hypothetical protein [Verrucomicrobiae bacterium]
MTVPSLVTILAAVLSMQQQCLAQQQSAYYQNGDKIAEIGLAELISGAKSSPPVGFFSRRFGSDTAWVYSGLAACLLTGGAAVIRRRHRRPHRRRRRAHAPVSAPAIISKIPVTSVSANPSSVPINNSESKGYTRLNPPSNRSNLARPFRRHHRKRMFDYPKFFTKVMGDAASHYYIPFARTNGKFRADQPNGHLNGSRGHDNDHAAANGMNPNQTTKSEIADLIATQKDLIKQQKSLLEQQTRLIEEKRQLLAAQTAILKSQSSLPVDQQPYWPNQQAA